MTVTASARRWLDARTTGESGALFRMGLGVVSVWHFAIGIGPQIDRYFTDAGVFPVVAWRASGLFWPWSVFALASSTGAIYAVWIACLAAAVLLTLGVATRVSAAMLWVGAVSFYNRNPAVMTGADDLHCILCFLAILAPLSLRGSLRFGSRRDDNATAPALWLHAIRFELLCLYASTCAHKLASPMWRDGTAIGLVLGSERFAHWPLRVPAVVSAVLTYAVLAVEGTFPLVLWRRARPWVLASGVVLHVAIAVLMKVPEFSAMMLASYPAMLDDDEAAALMARWRTRASRAPGLAS